MKCILPCSNATHHRGNSIRFIFCITFFLLLLLLLLVSLFLLCAFCERCHSQIRLFNRVVCSMTWCDIWSTKTLYHTHNSRFTLHSSIYTWWSFIHRTITDFVNSFFLLAAAVVVVVVAVVDFVYEIHNTHILAYLPSNKCISNCM